MRFSLSFVLSVLFCVLLVTGSLNTTGATSNPLDGSSDFPLRDAVSSNDPGSRIQPVVALGLSNRMGDLRFEKFTRAKTNTCSLAPLNSNKVNSGRESAAMLLIGSGLVLLAEFGRKMLLDKKE